MSATKIIARVFSVNVLTSIIQLVANLYVYREIGPAQLGIFATSVVVIDIITVAANLGVNQYVIKFPNSFGVFGLIFKVVCFQAIAFVALSFTGYILFRSVGDVEESSIGVFSIVLASRVLNLFGTLYFSPLEGNLDYNPIVKSRLISRLLAVLSLFALLPFLSGSLVLGIREFIYSAVYLVAAYFYSKDLVSYEVSKIKAKSIIGFTLPLYSLNIFERVAPRIDLIGIRYFLGNDALGIYYGIRQIFEGFYGFIAGVIQTVVFSVYSNMKIAENTLKKIRNLSYWILILSIFIWGLSFFWGNKIPEFILGDEYGDAGTIWLIFIAYFGALVIFENSKVSHMSLNAHGKMIVPRFLQLALIVVSLIIVGGNLSLFWAATILYLATLVLSLISVNRLSYVWNSRSFPTK